MLRLSPPPHVVFNDDGSGRRYEFFHRGGRAFGSLAVKYGLSIFRCQLAHKPKLERDDRDAMSH